MTKNDVVFSQSPKIATYSSSNPVIALYMPKMEPEFNNDQVQQKTVGRDRSAVDKLSELMERVAGKKPVFFLDYDGTLSPIVDVPDEAFMNDEMRETVRKLTNHFPCAIVSGREKLKLKNFVQLEGLFYAGSHGMDISGPNDSQYHFEIGTPHVVDIQRAIELIKEGIKNIPGAWIENNRFSFSVHYRLVDPAKVDQLEQVIDKFLKTELGHRLRKGYGKKVFELKPKVNWDKGAALMWILKVLELDTNPDVIPFYIGDDVTDEDAFRVLSRQRKGVPIVVTEEPESRQTYAEYWLGSTKDVEYFLRAFVDRAEACPEPNHIISL